MISQEPPIPLSPERLKALPKSPGVYLMRDRDGLIIYIGKAKSLRARVRSYFNGTDDRHSIKFLLQRIFSIDTVVTEDERQAIVLEADLIRQHKPRYNIRLKDDKAHLLARIDLTAEWPRIELVRSAREDGAKYIGPFAFGYELRTVMDVLKRAVPLRTCSDSMLKNRVRPCLEYQIKRCAGPCCLPVNRAEYLSWVDQAINILQGKNEDVVTDLEQQMEQASEQLRFEQAAEIRDRIKVLTQVREENQQFNLWGGAQDAFSLYREGTRVEVSVLLVRNGRLFASKTFGFPEVEIPDSEVLSAVLSQYYAAQTDLPGEIILPFMLEDIEVRQEMLRELKGSAISISVPKKGAKARLLALATANAQENFSARFADADRSNRLLHALKRELNLDELPRTMECVDVSHFQGDATVASVVCFVDGRPEKTRYRCFNLTQEGKPDDFASMREVVMRHLSRGAEENTLPDLLIIDGGPGQLSSAMEMKRELGITKPEIVSLAKKRTTKTPYLAISGVIPAKRRGGRASTERVYLPGKSAPVVMPPEGEVTHLLERIRDEAHRFAISFHRRTRTKRAFSSKLERIQGVGEKRRRELLKEFGSVKAIAKATPEELTTRCAIPPLLAERILRKLAEEE